MKPLLFGVVMLSLAACSSSKGEHRLTDKEFDSISISLIREADRVGDSLMNVGGDENAMKAGTLQRIAKSKIDSMERARLPNK